MRLLKRDPHGPVADGSFKELNCYGVSKFAIVSRRGKVKSRRGKTLLKRL
jgi:hypothetical protein